jgi:hypothetical protein
MSKRKRRTAFGIAAVLLALNVAAFTAVPTEAWARPGGSHHESNQGEVFKHQSFWKKVIAAILVHIVRPVTHPGGDDGSGPVCR